MRKLSNITMISKKKLFLASALLTIAVFGFTKIGLSHAQNIVFNTKRDCDTNAVVDCGAMSTTELISKYNANKSVQTIYSYFGISSASVNGMTNSAVAGAVLKDGSVYANGKLVATGAVTAGRTFISGSTQVTSNGVTFYKRTPSVSFLSNSLDAYVVMSGGKFQYAILASCGNPVTAKAITPPAPKPPAPKPAYTLTKQVQTKGGTGWEKTLKVKTGTEVVYQITVESTGKAPVMDLKVHDTLPADTAYVHGSLRQDGAVVPVASFFSTGIVVPSLAPGHKVVFTFNATVGPKDTPVACQPEVLTNTAYSSATSLTVLKDTAVVDKECLAKPVYSCDLLQTTQLTRVNYQFDVSATAQNGAVITNYNIDFGDNSTPYTGAANTTMHTYAKPGSYPVIASVTVVPYVGAKSVVVTSKGCDANITVKPAPAAECTNLTLSQDKTDPKNVTATVTDKLSNGAKLDSVTYDFDDGSVPLQSNQLSANHVYAADGDYTVSASLVFSAPKGDTVPTSTCQAKITVTTPTPPQVLGASTPTPPAAPTSLVNTGPGDVIGIFAGVTIVGALMHRYFVSRRLNSQATK